MTPDDLQKFNYAVSLAQKGDTFTARSMLNQLAPLYPTDSNLLLWLAFTAESQTMARNYVERVAQLDPTNASLAGAQSWLTTTYPSAQTSPNYPSEPIYQAAGSANQSSTQTYQSATATYNTLPSYGAQTPSYSAAPNNSFNTAQLRINENIAKEQGRSPFRFLIGLVLAISGGIILLGVLVIVLLALLGPQIQSAASSSTVTTTDTVKAKGLPVYNGARLLNLSQNGRRNFIAGFNNNITEYKDLAFEMYAIKRSEVSKVLPYYSAEIQKLGWTPFQENMKSGSAQASTFTKGDRVFSAFTMQVSQEEFRKGGMNLPADEVILGVATYTQT